MNAKTPLALAAASLLALAAAGCADDTATTDTTVVDPTVATPAAVPVTAAPATDPAMATPPATPMVATSQAEALAAINAVNQHEINVAQQAKSKNVTGPALEYANMMEADHSKNMAETRALLDASGGMPAGSQLVNQLETLGRQHVDRLAPLEGDAYARAYIDQMVTDHEMALGMLDASMPAVTDARVREHVTMTRNAIQSHLERAREIQGTLGGAVGGTGQAPVAQ